MRRGQGSLLGGGSEGAMRPTASWPALSLVPQWHSCMAAAHMHMAPQPAAVQRLCCASRPPAAQHCERGQPDVREGGHHPAPHHLLLRPHRQQGHGQERAAVPGEPQGAAGLKVCGDACKHAFCCIDRLCSWGLVKLLPSLLLVVYRLLAFAAPTYKRFPAPGHPSCLQFDLQEHAAVAFDPRVKSQDSHAGKGCCGYRCTLGGVEKHAGIGLRLVAHYMLVLLSYNWCRCPTVRAPSPPSPLAPCYPTGKVVDRHWYSKNKHIYPASRWAPFDEAKQYPKHAEKPNC